MLTSALCLWAQFSQAQDITPQRAIQEAKRVWVEEGGRVWGRNLAGPLLIVDPKTRHVWASESDGAGFLKKQGDVYTGVYPESEVVANTVVRWGGKDWIMVLLPLPSDEKERAVLFIHEAWHRVQGDLNLNVPEAFNSHLDTINGRYWLQLEWRALAKALELAGDGKERQSWIAAAIACRRHRQSLFPQAADEEKRLELGEGLAEYTGIRAVGAKEFIIKDLKKAAHPFARSFAYTSGPAYGLLLDDKAPGWNLGVNQDTDISVLLQKAYKIPAPAKADAEAAAAKLGGAELRIRETAAERKRNKHLVEIIESYLDGPVLIIPQGFRIQFNPSNTENIEGVGVYHPTATYLGDWGRLEAVKGSLRSQDWSEARVVAPADTTARPILGPGWILDLTPGWTIATADSNGSFKIVREIEKH
ncbi:MAG: hypothetical protein LBB40_01320 [Holophagales bacterium]|jgi:hypothetical protein|nr:hypothetical protein [Holophagales bacterium]